MEDIKNFNYHDTEKKVNSWQDGMNVTLWANEETK
jgi:hypothetical protein